MSKRTPDTLATVLSLSPKSGSALAPAKPYSGHWVLKVWAPRAVALPLPKRYKQFRIQKSLRPSPQPIRQACASTSPGLHSPPSLWPLLHLTKESSVKPFPSQKARSLPFTAGSATPHPAPVCPVRGQRACGQDSKVLPPAPGADKQLAKVIRASRW